MAEFRMPSLGSDMEAGTLLEWLVKPGDQVKRRDIIAVVETDKAAIEIEVYEDGIVDALLVQPGEKVPVGTVMAVFRAEGEPKAARTAAGPEQAVQPPTTREKEPETGSKPSSRAATEVGSQRLKASPYARRLAAEQGLDLHAIRAGGSDGAIHAADLGKPTATAPLEPSPGRGETPAPPSSGLDRDLVQPEASPVAEKPAAKDSQAAMRRAIATLMARSKKEIPHYYLQTRIDMSRTLHWLEEQNMQRPIKERILPVIPLIRAVTLALGDVPELNGFWREDRHQISESIHIGFVISLRQGGIMAPAILNADDKSLDELVPALHDLITRTRSGGLRSSELTEATVTITNLGDLGVETVYGIIYPPQVALVGFGKITEQPWAENGMLGVRPVLTATLAADHRATDGHRGAQFLDALNRYLQEPAHL